MTRQHTGAEAECADDGPQRDGNPHGRRPCHQGVCAAADDHGPFHDGGALFGVEGKDPDGVGACSEKRGMAQAHQSTVAQDQVQAHRCKCIDHHAAEQRDEEWLVHGGAPCVWGS